MRKVKKKNNKKIGKIKIIAIVAAVLTISGATLVFAVPDESNSVHIDASEIENSTLIIGSHLIYLGSMNDQVYDIAEKSAEEWNQHSTYYKSEIAGGIWYEITEAQSLADITSEGRIVDEKEIEELWMTHHTKSDGITYDLRTGTSISVFDIDDPYNLEDMEELEPIKLQYDTLLQTEDPSDTNERDILYIEEVYKKERKTDVTNEMDQNLDALQAYYENLMHTDAEAAKSDMVMTVMEKIDSARRAEVLEALTESELETMSKVIGREFVYIEGEVTGDFLMSEDRLKRAEEAANAVRAEIVAQVTALEKELETLTSEIDAKAEEAAEKERASWRPLIALEENEEKKAELTEQMEKAAAEAAEEERAVYAGVLQTKQEEVNTLKEGADARIEEAQKAATEEIMNEEREVIEGFIQNTDLLTAIGEAMDNVQESHTSYSSNMLEEGETVLSKKQYEVSMELVEAAKAADYSMCDQIVDELICLDNINNGIIRNDAQAKEFIESELLQAAEEAYKASLGAGEGEEYKQLSSMATAAAKTNVLKSQKNETEILRNELQFIAQAYIDRMPAEDAQAYITQCMEDAEALRSVIQEDDYAEYANSSVDAYMSWLKDTLGSLQDSLGSGMMDSLMDAKQKLQTEQMSALDDNDLELAKQIEAQIAAVDMQLEEEEQRLNAILNSDMATDAEKAQAVAQLGAGSTSAALQDMKDNVLDDLRNEELDGIENSIHAIGTLAATLPESALSALKDIYQEVSNQILMNGDTAGLSDLLNVVEEVTAEQMENFLRNLSENDLAVLIQAFVDENIGNEDGSGDGNESSSLSGKLEDVMNQQSDKNIAVILAGLSQYAEQTGSKSVKDVLADYAKIAENDDNAYVFSQYKGDITSEFLPSDQLARIIQYRYIFNDSQKAVTLQKGSRYYKFDAFSNIAQKGSDQVEMPKAAGFSKVIYIVEEVAEEFFALSSQYLYDTSYGVILTDAMEEQAEAFVDYLLEAGGEF